MPRVHPIINKLNGGELAPTLEGRLDLPGYYDCVHEMTNVIAVGHGGAESRPGWRFVASAKHADKKARLIPFEYSDTQNYVLEIGDEYMRPFMNGGQIVVLSAPELVTNGTFTSDIASWTDLHSPMSTLSWDSGFMALDPDGHAEQAITLTPGQPYRLTFDTGGSGISVRGGSTSGAVNLIALTPYAAGTGHTIDFTAGAATMYLGFYNHTGAATTLDNVSVILATNLVTNGAFGSNITGWTDLFVPDPAEKISWNPSGFMALTPYGHGEQAIATVIGQTYTLRFDVGGAGVSVRGGSTSGAVDLIALTPFSVGPNKTVDFTASTTTIYIGFYNHTASDAAVDNVSCMISTNAITNGTFATSITGWTDISTEGYIYWHSYLYAMGLTAGAKAEQAITTVVGQQYRITFDVGGDGIYIRGGSASGLENVIPLTGFAPAGVGYTLTFTASTTTLYLGFRNATSVITWIDNVSCVPVGTELITNGQFPTGIASWTDISTPSASISWDALGHMDLVVYGRAEQAITLTIGQSYRLRFDVGGDGIYVRGGSATGLDDLLPLTGFAPAGTYELNFTATATTLYLGFFNATTVASTLDNVSCIRLTATVVTNGTFASDISDWDDISTPTTSISWDTAFMAFIPYGRAEQALTLTPGSKYRLSFDAGGQGIYVRGGSATGLADRIQLTGFETGTGLILDFTAVEATLYLGFYNFTAVPTTLAVFDDRLPGASFSPIKDEPRRRSNDRPIQDKPGRRRRLVEHKSLWR